MEKKTPLYDTHVAMQGKIVEFGGFLMPVQYSGVIAEHMAVREKAGLFDVSHMGELLFKGPDAVANIQKLVTTD
ncbi:MAG: glycine cleavage system aminomethyltransferase GcvT, partial [Oscillospiraceae bacterium]|nr:glycine cleavage system aminomethyltransferase GcvT [Oscillospiraceae bacterium]